jgi:hypothetical protein
MVTLVLHAPACFLHLQVSTMHLCTGICGAPADCHVVLAGLKQGGIPDLSRCKLIR